jgi:AGZA family xanthine/uracil permease-like MFS transporter
VTVPGRKFDHNIFQAGPVLNANMDVGYHLIAVNYEVISTRCDGTNVRTEFVAGLTTFLTMVYIVFVNPAILGNAGMDKGAVFAATCIAAAASTLVMAFYANYPIALAPGMDSRKIIGGTLIGILIVSLIGIPLGLASFGGIVSALPSLTPTLFKLDFSRMFEATFLIVVFSFLIVDVFDNAGTLIGVTHRTGLLDSDGNLPRMREALIADSFAAMFGALIGTSTTTSYIESAAGVSAGGRTGLTAFFVAMFFLLALFFSPLAGMIPAYASAAALLYVACVMTRGLAEIDWDDITESAPAVIAAVTMPLTYSIATGIGLGFITYALGKIVSGRFADAKPAVLGLALLFAFKFALPG